MSRVETKLTFVPPRLVLITGSGGVGKTSLIEGLHIPNGRFYPGLIHRIVADIVDKDRVANLLTEVRDHSYVERFREQSYEAVYQETEKIIAGGRTALVNASFRLEIGRPGWQNRYEESAQRHGAILKIIRLVTAPETLYKRLMERGASTDTHKLTDPQTWQAYLLEEPIEVEMPPGSLILTNNGDISDFPPLVTKALTFLRENRIDPVPGLDVV